MAPDQIAGCFLHGGQLPGAAFQKPFVNNNNDTVGGGCPEDPSACPPPEPPQPAPEISIAPPPPPPPEFSCPGLFQNLRAQVVGGPPGYLPVGRAKPGTALSFMQISADFCQPKSAVTLTLYVKPKGSTNHKQRRKSKAARTSAPRHSSTEHLLAQVHFCPFTVPKGPSVKLRFRVPDRYQPTHVGLHVQPVQDLPPGERHPVTKVGKPSHGTPACPPPNFRPVGSPPGGAIIAIHDASYLHHAAPSHLTKSSRRRGHGRHKGRKPRRRRRA
jgi:hypothetical protein